MTESLMWLTHMAPWHWACLGLVLIILETLGTAGVFLWLGIGALLVSVLAWLFPLSWVVQLVLFAGLSFLVAILWRVFWYRFPPKTEAPLLNQRVAQLVGREFFVNEQSMKAVQLGGTQWAVEAAGELQAGMRVRVTAIEGTTLHVVPVENQASGA